MPSVILVTRTIPYEVGTGGKHRAYQILYDLERVLGKGSITIVESRDWRSRNYMQDRKLNSVARVASQVVRRLPGRLTKLLSRYLENAARYHENPYKLLAPTSFTVDQFLLPEFLSCYEDIVTNTPGLVACIIDDSRLGIVAQANWRFGVPTVGCFHNLESLDQAVVDPAKKWGIHATANDFANEFKVFAQCRERLFISKVEVGLISGLGLPSYYYPYLPVGAIRQRLESIRQKRSRANIESGLFLMVGSASHRTTRESFTWFVQNVQVHGLPKGVRVVVGGEKTDKLLPSDSPVPGLELRGWLEQDELDQLMVQAQAVLAPQQRGFGALTRLSELSCAGIPVITSRHATYAMDLPPGVHIVDDEWDAWYARMEQFAHQDATQSVSSDDYYVWGERQPRTLETVIERLLEES